MILERATDPYMSQIYALIDCNNFYVSCERVFNPQIRNVPVVVLSNNDGCVVARSNEVKNAGIAMAAPYFKCAKELEQMGCHVFSSNYALYGDMSARVMSIISQYCNDMEVYSIDEAFVLIDNNGDIREYMKYIQQQVYQCTGIPVSIGVGYTKTQAKLANYVAKYDMRKGKKLYNGVFSLVTATTSLLDHVYQHVDVGELWGIGRQYTKKLHGYNIHTVQQLIQQPREWIQKQLSIQGVRLVFELQGIVCYPLEQNPEPKKGIASTRSFGASVYDLADMRAAVASYCTRVGEKLRHGGLAASYIQVFVMTNRFKSSSYYQAMGVSLSTQTHYTPDLITHAYGCLDKVFHEGLAYKKAGVMVTGLVPQSHIRTSLFDSVGDIQKQGNAMNAVDSLNKKYGQGAVRLAAQGFSTMWHMNRDKVSPRYTTVWGELLQV